MIEIKHREPQKVNFANFETIFCTLILFTRLPSQQPPWQLQKQASACSKCYLYCFGPYLCLCECARATFEWSDAEISMKNQQHAHCENCFSAQCTTNTTECALVTCTACKVKMHGCMDARWTIIGRFVGRS